MPGQQQRDTRSCQGTQTPQVPLPNSFDNWTVDFGPLQRAVKNRVWTTELDRIMVLRVGCHGELRTWLRLIGPARTLNLQLNPPKLASLEGIMAATTEPIPEEHEDLVELRVAARGCIFADVYVFLRQFGLDEWIFFPGGSSRDRYVGSSSWT